METTRGSRDDVLLYLLEEAKADEEPSYRGYRTWCESLGLKPFAVPVFYAHCASIVSAADLEPTQPTEPMEG